MIESIIKYFPQLEAVQIERFSMLADIYREWNARINVISRKDIDNLYVNHVLHSLAIGKFLNPVDGTTFIDVGTGGGFPGIPLAILYPRCTFHLIDRIRKKITVVDAVKDAIGLENVTSQAGDLGECHARYDYAVSRAVMPMADLVKVARRNIGRRNIGNIYPNGIVALKGGDLAEELKALNLQYFEEKLTIWFNEPYFDTKSIIYVPV